MNKLLQMREFVTKFLLRRQQDGSLPECCFSSAWIQDAHLAIVFIRRKISKTQAKLERDYLQPLVRSLGEFDGLALERFGIAAIERDKRNQRLNALALLISFQVNVQGLILTKHARDAGNQLLAILNQRIGSFGAVFVLDRVIKRVLDLHALAAQNNRADGDALFLFVQVGNDERSLI